MKFEIFTPEEAAQFRADRQQKNWDERTARVLSIINHKLDDKVVFMDHNDFFLFWADAHWVIFEMMPYFFEAGWLVEKVYADEGFWIWKERVFKGWQFTPIKEKSL